jgi:hypothetical protein
MTLSNFRMFLRMSKLRASTFCCAFSSALLIHGWTIASSSLRQSFCSMPSMRSDPKMPHQVVFERQVELGAAGIALAAGAAAQLIVDAPALVPLGAQHVEPAGLDGPSSFGHIGQQTLALLVELRLVWRGQPGLLTIQPQA